MCEFHSGHNNLSAMMPIQYGCGLAPRARVTHVWVDNLTIIGSDNGLAPGRRQAIIRTSAGVLLIGTLGQA